MKTTDEERDADTKVVAFYLDASSTLGKNKNYIDRPLNLDIVHF